MATPLIRIPKDQGGTMYAFASAAKDLTRAYYNPDMNFEYSKFALLDMPVVDVPSGGATDNFIRFTNLRNSTASGGAAGFLTANANRNVDFAKTFQNYALNLEDWILSDDDYDATLLESDAEKIFFKYLNQMGAFRTRAATSAEAVNSRLVEEDSSSQSGSEYSQVVRYLGNIDVSNDKQYGGEAYNEIFINVPSAVGYTPNILFKESNFNTTETDYAPQTLYINGRTSQTHPDVNLDMQPIVDNTDSGGINGTASTVNGVYNVDPNETTHCGIEWENQEYAKIVSDQKLNNILDFSKRGGDFRFNAILVYYDIYSKSNPSNRATNLYGVILLDNFKDDPNSTGWYIPELTKNKPNDITGLNGNSFALKLNVKFNSSLDNVGIETNVNDFSTFSMDIFFDTTSSLENAARLLLDANQRYGDIAERLVDLENITLTTTTSTELEARILSLETSVVNANLNFADSTSVLDLITSANDRINKMISGEIDASVQVNTDIIVAGGDSGIMITRSTVDNTISLKSKSDGYNLSGSYIFDKASLTIDTLITPTNKFLGGISSTKGVWLGLRPFNNLIRIYNDSTVLSDNLNIYIDDSTTNWTKGHVVRVTFRDVIDIPSGMNINVFMDKLNGWVHTITIPTIDLIQNSAGKYKPYIEIVCTDEINKTFETDIIR
tara:strand:- start:353 stop:2353 length:2001 start_codon:yes stop_codon:yes gene_type:complete